MKPIQYARARALVEKMDALVIGNEKLRDVFVVDGADGWQMYRQRVFTMAKEWSRDPSTFSIPKQTYGLKAYILHGIFLFRSLLALWRAKKRGVHTLIYTTDKISTNTPLVCDKRIAELYRVLVDRNESFLEIVHGAYNRKTFVHAKRRKRDVVYYEVLHGLPGRTRSVVPAYDTSGFDAVEKVCAEIIFRTMVEAVAQSQRVITRTKRLCEWLDVKVLYSIDDPRYYYELLHAAHSVNAKTVAIQHGHITKYHLGWLSYGETPYIQVAPQKFIVWSSYWKRELERLGSHSKQDTVVVARKSHGTQESRIALKDGDLQVIFPYETDAPKEEVTLAIKAACACNTFSVIFKVRGDIDAEGQLKEYGLTEFKHERFAVETEVTPKPNMLVIGTYSTYLYDMIERMVPVAYLDTTLDFGIGLVDNGLAEKLVPGHMFCSDVMRVYQEALKRCVVRKEKLVDAHAPLLHEVLNI